MPKGFGRNRIAFGSSLGIGVDSIEGTYPPTDLVTTEHFVQIATDNFQINPGTTFGLTSSGFVFGWGRNDQGALATGALDSDPHPIPQLIPGLSGIVKIAAQNGSGFALDSLGDLYGWGLNNSYSLGLGDNLPRTTVTLLLPPGPVADVVAGGDAWTIIMLTNGDVYTVGLNNFGQLGNGSGGLAGDFSATWQFVAINGAGIYGFRDTTMVRFANGTVGGWGHSGEGLLGNTNTVNTSIQMIPGPGGVGNLTNVVDVGQAGGTAFFLLADGSSYAIGHNADGKLGVGLDFASLTRTLTPLSMAWPIGVQPVRFGKCVSEINTSGTHHACIAVGSDGRPYTWGTNVDGQMGDNGVAPAQSSPVWMSGIIHVSTVEGGGISMWIEDDVARVRSWAQIIG